jgi:hypothetical protein
MSTARAEEADQNGIPWFLHAVLFSSTSIILGLIWDICWHRTVGRDTFWSPPHMAIYAGGIVAGLSSAAVIFRTTFFAGGKPKEGVRVWGLTGPLGAFCCAWGAGAMLTSAPFDDWWHNAYGLDVTILSPPHTVLALGIMAIQVGAMLTAVAHQNRMESGSEGPRLTALRVGYVYSAGLLFTSATILVYEQTVRALMHSSGFYLVTAGLFAFLLVAPARASRLRWPATCTAAVYTIILLAQLWILPLVPAEPRLGPVRHHVDHFVPLQFPLLVLVPALILDVILRRWSVKLSPWVMAVVAGASFLTVYLAVQWPFADFLMSAPSRNFLFGTQEYPYYLSLEVFMRHQQFISDTGGALLKGLAFALGLAALTSRLGLAFGGWMSRVQR